MQMYGRRFFLAAYLVLAAPSGAFALTLDGWSVFKFGMTPEQARAQPGQQLGRYSDKNIMEENRGAMASLKPALIYGLKYNFDLLFNSFRHLDEIALQNEQTGTRAECESSYLTLLAGLEKNYGIFGPIYAKAKKNDQDQIPIAIEWKNSPGKSHYQLATVYLDGETAFAWNARAVSGNFRLDAAAVWSAPQPDNPVTCLLQMDFKWTPG